MKKIVFFSFLILCLDVSGQTRTQKQLLEKTIEKYRAHTGISYDIQYDIKYFDEEKWYSVTSHVDMLKVETDTIFGGVFRYNRNDSLADVIKYYKPDSLLIIDLKNELITHFDASKGHIFPITGNIDGSVIETYFLDSDKLQQKLENPQNSVVYSDTATYLKVTIRYLDEEEYTGQEESIYIDKKTKTIQRITYQVGYKNQVQKNQWLLNNIVFDQVQQTTLDSLAGDYLKTFKLETYRPLTEADLKLLDKGAIAPEMTGKIFPDYDKTVRLTNKKILILDFWYTSCMPCIQTIPLLNKLQEKYSDYVEIVGVNPVENKVKQKEKIAKFLKHTPINYPILIVDEVPKAYNVRAYPTLYAIGPDGKVLYASRGFSENSYEELDKLLAQVKATAPNGTWKQQGYGQIIQVQVKDSALKVYSVTKQNCTLLEEGTILDFGTIKSCKNDTLIMQHGIDEWVFTRLNGLPPLCDSASQLNTDPETNFQTFWETFDEQYPSFAIKGIDWNSVYAKYRPGITKNTTELELYTVFSEMIGLLNDGHVKMDIPESIAKDFEKRKKKKTKVKYSKLDEFQLSKGLAELYVDSLRSRNGGIVRYGTIDNKIGYIQVNAMLLLADYDLPDSLDLGTFFMQYGAIAGKRKSEIQRQEEVAGAHALIASILDELDSVSAYILDLRFNGGGKDGAALAILNHFSAVEKQAFTKKAREGNGFANLQEIKLIPAEPRFTGNVYLLTSNQTASAAEILVLASLANQNCTKIGSTTEGIFSSTLDRKLPNGWEFELSNEVYQDLKGTNYETTGIPADFPFEYSKERDKFLNQLSSGLKKKKDQAVELVIELEKKKN